MCMVREAEKASQERHANQPPRPVLMLIYSRLSQQVTPEVEDYRHKLRKLKQKLQVEVGYSKEMGDHVCDFLRTLGQPSVDFLLVDTAMEGLDISYRAELMNQGIINIQDDFLTEARFTRFSNLGRLEELVNTAQIIIKAKRTFSRGLFEMLTIKNAEGLSVQPYEGIGPAELFQGRRMSLARRDNSIADIIEGDQAMVHFLAN